MAEVLILEFDGFGEAEYRAVNKELGLDMSAPSPDWPPGLLMHAGGHADEGALLVTEVWASRDDQHNFMTSRLGPALAAGGVTAVPKVTWATLWEYHQI